VLTNGGVVWVQTILDELLASIREGRADLPTLAPEPAGAPLLKEAAKLPHRLRDHFPGSQRRWRLRFPEERED